MKVQARQSIGLVLILAVWLAGCQSPPSIDGAIIADSSVNPDPGGRPSPIVVRLYEVTTADQIAGAGFFALFENPEQTLGDTLLARREFSFSPGETRRITTDLDENTRYLVVVAAYRNVDQAQWWAVQPIRPGRLTVVEIRLLRSAVVIKRK